VIPEIPPAIPPDGGGEVIARTPPVGPTLVEVQPPHVVSRVPGGPGIGFPATEDFYPSAAKRLEEQGIATVSVCVDAHGRLTSDPTTVQSSGNAKLDAGALQLAKAGSGHYRPSTEDGRPVDGCYSFRVRFQLRS
jgi:TonB family protein